MDDDDRELLESLHRELAATEELPVSREASAWLGEAQAVARGLLDAPEPVVAERIGHVRHLLGEAGDPGNEAVAEHLERARDLAAEVATAVEGGQDRS